MNDNKNMLLAIVLSALVLIGWSLLSDKFFPTAQPQTQQVENGKVKAAPQAAPAADAPRAIRNREAVLAETPRIRVETPNLKGSINLKGGAHRRPGPRRSWRIDRQGRQTRPALVAGRHSSSLFRPVRVDRTRRCRP